MGPHDAYGIQLPIWCGERNIKLDDVFSIMTHQDQGVFSSSQLPSLFQMLGDAKEVEGTIGNQGDINHQGSNTWFP